MSNQYVIFLKRAPSHNTNYSIQTPDVQIGYDWFRLAWLLPELSRIPGSFVYQAFIMNAMWHSEITVFILLLPIDIKSKLQLEIERRQMKGLSDIGYMHRIQPIKLRENTFKNTKDCVVRNMLNNRTNMGRNKLYFYRIEEETSNDVSDLSLLINLIHSC